MSYWCHMMSYVYDCTWYIMLQVSHTYALFFQYVATDWTIPVHLPKVQWVSGATESRPWRLTTTGGAVRLDLGISRLVRFGTADCLLYINCVLFVQFIQFFGNKKVTKAERWWQKSSLRLRWSVCPTKTWPDNISWCYWIIHSDENKIHINVRNKLSIQQW